MTYYDPLRRPLLRFQMSGVNSFFNGNNLEMPSSPARFPPAAVPRGRYDPTSGGAALPFVLCLRRGPLAIGRLMLGYFNGYGYN